MPSLMQHYRRADDRGEERGEDHDLMMSKTRPMQQSDPQRVWDRTREAARVYGPRHSPVPERSAS